MGYVMGFSSKFKANGYIINVEKCLKTYIGPPFVVTTIVDATDSIRISCLPVEVSICLGAYMVVYHSKLAHAISLLTETEIK